LLAEREIDVAIQLQLLLALAHVEVSNIIHTFPGGQGFGQPRSALPGLRVQPDTGREELGAASGTIGKKPYPGAGHLLASALKQGCQTEIERGGVAVANIPAGP